MAKDSAITSSVVNGSWVRSRFYTGQDNRSTGSALIASKQSRRKQIIPFRGTSPMDHKDQTICNQAKALEGMRERLRNHGRKLTERQQRIRELEQENLTLQSQLTWKQKEILRLRTWIAESTSHPSDLNKKYRTLWGKFIRLLDSLQTSSDELRSDNDRPNI